ncbi:MAG: hypothetical protein JRJ38_17590 [Deltaproteobacteria bacterium]|nr:hypothetical protein [Deltaproteobacteria bacterium]
MKPITIIWALFTILFFCLGILHLLASNRNIAPFEIKDKGSAKKIMGIPIHTGLENFVIDFNSYIEAQNKSNRTNNRLSALGYFAASLMAILSMLLTIKGIWPFE